MEFSRNHPDHRRLDKLRRGRGPIQEHVIDELVAGRLSRRQFVSRATKVGLSLPLAAAILEACGSSAKSSTTSGTTPTTSNSSTSTAPGKAGATIRAGIITPAGAINPITINDVGGLETLGQVGEFLVFVDQQLNYQPLLATSWDPNADASVWTFKIRQGVKFNDGTPMTVDDVVYSFQTQSNPKGVANALSVFGGVLIPDGVVKVDDETVAFHLLVPDGGFVDAVTQDNYNMIIVPNGYDYANYQKQFIGTGKFKMTSYTTNVGATFVRNPYYWGTPALPAALDVTYYATEAAQTAALEAGTIDVNDGFSVAGSPQLLTGGYNVISLKSALHRELSMRCDVGPFVDPRVRRAVALTLDRPAIVNALFKGYATVGNDSPFAPIFPSTNTSVPQRVHNLTEAKQLLAAAGFEKGFSVTLATETLGEIPQYAQIVKASAAAIGIDINLSITSSSLYYGDAVFGKSNWLDATMSLSDYGSRGVPNVYLEAPLQTYNTKTGAGSWNAAHFNNSTYDKLSQEFVAASDLSTQRQLAGQIETLLQEETPIIYAYFYDVLIATQKNVSGVYPTQEGIFYYNATIS